MLKKTMGSLLFIVLLAGVLAPAAAAGEEEILTLEKAQDLALANSPLLKLSELEYQEKSYAASAASNAYRDLQKTSGRPITDCGMPPSRNKGEGGLRVS